MNKRKILKLPLPVFIALAVVFVGSGFVVGSILLGGSGDIALQKGLVGHWTFDDASSGTAKDSTPYSNHGTVYGATSTADRKGQSGKAYSSNGSGNYIDVAESDIFDIDIFSVTFWFKTSSWDDAYHTLISCGVSGGWPSSSNEAWNIFNHYTGEYLALSIGGDGSFDHERIYHSSISLNEWHHFAMVITAGEIIAYMDGEYYDSNSHSIDITSTDYSLEIGEESGEYDDVRIYNRALSEDEITALYESYNPSVQVADTQKGLVGHWKFDVFSEYTENVVTNTNLDTGWSKGHTQNILWNDIDPPDGVDSQVVSFENDDTGGSGYWYSYGDYAPQEDGTTYTVSLWVKTNQTSDVNIRFYTADNGESDRYTGEYLTVNSSEGWKRLVWDSFTTADPTDSDSLSFKYTNLYEDGYTRMWLCAPQIEAKTYATPFTEGTREDVVRDATPYSNHAILNSNTPRWATSSDSKIGSGSYEFDGENDYMEILNNENLNITKNLTLTAWIKPVATGEWVGIISKLTGGNDKQYSLSMHSSGALRFDYEKSANDYGVQGGSLVVDSWQYVTATLDESLNIKLYINGEEVASDTAPAETISTSEPVVFGRWSGSYNGNYFPGFIDDVRIYNRVLSEDEIQNIYESYNPVLQASDLQKGLVGHWTFDDASSGTTKDSTPYSNHGTVYGATSTADRKGQSGKAYSFDGTNDYMNVNSFSIPETGTFSFWVNPDSSGSWANNTAVWRGNVSVSTVRVPRFIYYSEDWRIYDSDGDLLKITTINWDQWTQYTIVWSPIEWKLYINGSLDYSGDVGFGVSNNNLLEFGRGYWSGHCSSGWCYFPGLIDDVRIYNRVLSESEIQQLYDSYR